MGKEAKDFTDDEKSVMLAKLIGLKPMKTRYGDPDFWRGEDGKLHAANFYHPENMRLAWDVLNWAAKREDDLDDYSYPYYFAQNIEWLFDTTEEIEDQLWAKPIADVQRLLMDQVIDTAFEAGLIEGIR